MGSDVTPISAPEPLADVHEIDEFCCDEPSLDDWLKRRARANQISGASRTFVATRNSRVIAYYALAAGAIASNKAPTRLRRNMPDPIPVFVLGRLAVDRSEQGKMLGALLLRDAILRSRRAAEFGGVAGVLVHAISEHARQFYLRHGFIECPHHPMTLVARMKDLA